MYQIRNILALQQDLIVIFTELAALALLFSVLYGATRLVFGRLAGSKFANTRIVSLRSGMTKLLVVVFVLAGICVAAFNSYLIYQNVDLLGYTLSQIDKVPAAFWTKLLKNIALVGCAGFLTALVIRILRKFLAKMEHRSKAYEQIRANDESIHAFFHALDRIQTNSLWLLMCLFSANTLPFPESLALYLYIGLKVYLIVAIGILIVKAVAAIVDSLDALSRKYSSPDNWLRFYDHVRVLIPLLRRCLEYIVYATIATLVILQMDFIAQLAKYGPLIVQVIGIFFLGRVAIELANLAVDRSMGNSTEENEADEQRRLTLTPLIKSILKYLIYFSVGVMILKTFQIDPTPILAGAGILGIVVGLGAQPLINDIVSGFFILFENIYLVNDFIETGNARGRVEAIDIRSTRIRGADGELHILRNGQIGEVINYSKQFAYAVVEVGVDYDSDLDHVYTVLSEVGKKIHQQQQDVVQPTEVEGLVKFGSSELMIRTSTRVKPGKHLAIARVLRKMIKEAFDQEGIEIPFARSVVIVKPDHPPTLSNTLTRLDRDALSAASGAKEA